MTSKSQSAFEQAVRAQPWLRLAGEAVVDPLIVLWGDCDRTDPSRLVASQSRVFESSDPEIWRLIDSLDPSWMSLTLYWTAEPERRAVLVVDCGGLGGVVRIGHTASVGPGEASISVR